MKSAALIFAATVLAACSGKSETPVEKTADGLAYHPGPGHTGDGVPTDPAGAPIAAAPTRR